jgi:DNA polymerase I-like protein with 3'-5' exonuclease and polymerase domains
MRLPPPVTVDFEGLGIEGRPDYPPSPVGVAIKWPNKKAVYLAWGHAVGNTHSWGEAYTELKKAWNHPGGILFQNAKFDLDVAEVHFGLPLPRWNQIHDTLFLLFLDDPHQRKLGLKESSERLLGIAPEERDEVGEWLLKHQPIHGVKISKSQNSAHYYGRYLAYAPVKLLGPYAIGDVDRTYALYKLLHKRTKDRKMQDAYDRERRLLPILLEMERQGLPVDLNRLRHDVAMYEEVKEKLDTWLRRQLRAGPDLNLDSGEQLIKALIEVKKADPGLMPLTPTGKYQTNKEALLLGVTDKVLLGVLKYRAQLSTCLGTFMKPWLAVAERSGGLIYTTWNQVRGPKGGDNVGTRTGRLSSTPNFQNIPKVFEAIFKHDEPDKKKARDLPRSPFPDLPPLPCVRGYIVPFPDEILIDRDFSQQELRILAHFDGGYLLERYAENPWIDFHDSTQEELAKVGRVYDRKPVKNTNFGLIYGMGVGKLALKNDMEVGEARGLKNAVLQLYPGLKEMYKDMKTRAKLDEPIRTWGGREYYCEPPRLVDGRIRQYDYKLVNVLIQGSAADCTKEAIIRYHAVKHPSARIILNVHDQITVSVPKKLYRTEMEKLREAMESVEFDVPILSEGKVSDVNWAELEDYDKKGRLVA